jgi:hypothetical protein
MVTFARAATARTRVIACAIALLLLFVLLFVFVRSRNEQIGEEGASSKQAEPSKQAAPSVADRAATLESSLRALEDAERSAPRDRWDPDYVASTLGSDPSVLLQWVRDNTSWVPYRGILRGANGVLMDRQGSSLDRAILLATLLETAGHKVRLAYRQRSDSEGQEQVLAMLDNPVRRAAAQPHDLTADGVRAAARQYGVNGEAVVRTVQTFNQAAVDVARTIDARVADQTSRLLRAVVRSDTNRDWMKRFGDAVSARREHWWVQLDAGGKWTDLDIDAKEAIPRSGVEAERIVLLKDLASAGLHHEIVVRVIAEQWSQGGVKERTVMEHALRPADLLGQTIAIHFAPESAIADPTPAPAAATQSQPIKSAIETAMGEQRAWWVSLIVGSDLVAGALLERRAFGGGSFGGLGSAIVAMNGADDRELSAVWLEYEFKVPGDSPELVRRTVFDLIGPAARSGSGPISLTLDASKQIERGLALTTQTELLPVSCRLSSRYVRHLLAENLIRNRNLLRTAVQKFGSASDETVDEAIDSAVPPVSPLYTLALARLDWGSSPQDVFIDRPGLLTAHTRFARQGTETVVRSAIDIVGNWIGVSLPVTDAFALRLAQGVLDTNAEAFLQPGPLRFDNTADAFISSEFWVAIQPGDDAAVAELQLSDDVRQRIRNDLAAGNAVVAPKSPVPGEPQPFSGWWRIDPISGDTLGLSASGWGSAAVERAPIEVRNSLAMKALRQAGIRAFWAFNASMGWCIGAQISSKGLRLGFTVANVVEQCVGDSLFIAGLAAVPLAILTVNIRFSSISAAECTVASEAALAETVPAPEGAPAEVEAAAEGVSREARSVRPGGPSEAAESIPPPRALEEIGAELNAALDDSQAAGQRCRAESTKHMKQQLEVVARDGILSEPLKTSPAYDAAFDANLEAVSRVMKLQSDYFEAGGGLGPNGRPAGPAGPAPPLGGWGEGPWANELGISPGPPGAPADPALANTVPAANPLGNTIPAANPLANPLANTVPAGGPTYAPVRGGPSNLATDPTVFVGLGGLAGGM